MFTYNDFNKFPLINKSNYKIGSFLLEESFDAMFSFYILQVVNVKSIGYLEENEYALKILFGINRGNNKLNLLKISKIYCGEYGVENIKVIPEEYNRHIDKLLIFG